MQKTTIPSFEISFKLCSQICNKQRDSYNLYFIKVQDLKKLSLHIIIIYNLYDLKITSILLKKYIK